jgi:hypothetical protein
VIPSLLDNEKETLASGKASPGLRLTFSASLVESWSKFLTGRGSMFRIYRSMAHLRRLKCPHAGELEIVIIIN